MTRPLRLESPNAIYHVTSRGDRREAIYEDDDDWLRLLEILQKGDAILSFLMKNQWSLALQLTYLDVWDGSAKRHQP